MRFSQSLLLPEKPARLINFDITYLSRILPFPNYIRPGPLARANARLVEAQSRIPLAQAWGSGEVASADGLRFVVPIRTLNAGPNSQYFHVERGVTYFNFASDQFTGFYGIVIPGTVHEGASLLEAIK